MSENSQSDSENNFKKQHIIYMCQNSRLKRFLSRLNLHFKHLIAQNIFDVSNVIRVAFSQVIKNIYQPTDSKNTKSKKTQKQLGDILGYSARTISDWEYNNTEPNIDAIVKLLKLYDISFEELIEN